MSRKRKFDMTPISYEEMAEEPALKGMLSFLELEPGKTPVLDFTKPDTVPEKDTVSGKDTVPDKPAPAIKTQGARYYFCNSAEDGHSLAEQRLYERLWNSPLARDESPSTRLITLGWDVMARLCRTTPRLARENCFRLLRKLALEKVAPHDSERRIGATYRVYAPGAVLERRRQAGLNFVIRNRGVRFVTPP